MKGRTSTRTAHLVVLFLVASVDAHWSHPAVRVPWATVSRGGDQEELTLDQKVRAAMQKLGISPPPPPPPSADDCVEGACSVPATASSATMETPQEETATIVETKEPQEDPSVIANRISKDMNVDSSLAWAALGATSTMMGKEEDRIYHERAARSMIQQELDLIAQIPEDSEQVQHLSSEGFDPFLCRRALAFAEGNMDDARAILLADKMDAEEEDAETAKWTAEQQQKEPAQKAFKTVTVDADFDPTRVSPPAAQQAPADTAVPAPADKASVVFDATADQIQELVLESPVPVLLDVYADWCGPCKALTPVLEEMAVTSGGAFRLVKVNSDNERSISGALEVQALPTVFGVNNGKIQHMFEGMPKSQESMKSFMMGLLLGSGYDPPITPAQQSKYDELSSKLLKTAGAASFSFSARERLQDRVMARLDELEMQAGVLDAETAAVTIRSLLSNILRNPFDTKFRKANLANKVIAAKVAKYPAAIAILRNSGYAMESNGEAMVVGKGKKIINMAPLSVVRDCIDKWIDKTRYEVARASRQRKDEQDRLRLQAEREAAGEAVEDEEEDEEEEMDPDACTLKVRMDGKKKVHNIELRADNPLSIILQKLPVAVEDGQDVQITCVAKRLVVKASDESIMRKTLRELGLVPSSAIVVSVGAKKPLQKETSKLSERAAEKKKKKKGSHTMQSIGIYAKDDNAKAELIDGGGGVWYEHDVSEDEDDAVEKDTRDSDEENTEVESISSQDQDDN